jgi:hypothetical protein
MKKRLGFYALCSFVLVLASMVVTYGLEALNSWDKALAFVLMFCYVSLFFFVVDLICNSCYIIVLFSRKKTPPEFPTCQLCHCILADTDEVTMRDIKGIPVPVHVSCAGEFGLH